jgi:hypothetical protein
VDVPIAVSFSDALLLKNGNLLFVNQAGNLLESRDDGRTMHVVATPPMPPIAAITQVGDDMFVTVGLAGAIPIQVGQSSASAMKAEGHQ